MYIEVKMCGIATIFNYGTFREAVDLSELRNLTDVMFSRGSDGRAQWVHEKKHIGLGHRRLAIIDLSSASAQPMVSADRNLHIVFNGEIYNYIELRKDLETKGYVFNSKGDTEVILYLYKEYGRSLVNYLRGMFAFVIWDDLKQGILIARDHFGMKPLYYSSLGLKSYSQVLGGGGLLKFLVKTWY